MPSGPSTRASSARPAAGEQASDWLGQRVITRIGTPLKIGRQIVDDGKDEARSSTGVVRIYRVERVQGPWLRLVPEHVGKRGWAKAAQVVPYDKAIDYFTEAIRLDPASASISSNRL